MKARSGQRACHSRLAIDSPPELLGGKHIGAVAHAERVENPRLRKLPERLPADATNDIAEQEEAKVRIEHRAAGAMRQRGAGGQPDPLVDRGMLTGSGGSQDWRALRR